MSPTQTSTLDFNPFTERHIAIGEVVRMTAPDGSDHSSCAVFFNSKQAALCEPQGDGSGLRLWEVDVVVLNELDEYLARLTPMKFSCMTLSYSLEMVMVTLMQAEGFSAMMENAAKTAVCASTPGDPFGSYTQVNCTADDVDEVIGRLNHKLGKGNWLMLGNPRDGACVPPAYYTQSSWTGTVK